MNSTGTASIADLGENLAELRAVAGAGSVVVTADAETRGVVDASSSAVDARVGC